MIELKKGNSVTFFRVTVKTIKDDKNITKDYLVNEYEAPNTSFAIAFVMEKISTLTEVESVSVIEYEIDFPDKFKKI